MPTEMTLTVALRKHIGYLPGQGLAEFAKECKQLNDDDKDWFKKRFLTEHDIKIVPPQAVSNSIRHPKA